MYLYEHHSLLSSASRFDLYQQASPTEKLFYKTANFPGFSSKANYFTISTLLFAFFFYLVLMIVYTGVTVNSYRV